MYRILLVEDDPVSTFLINKTIEKAGALVEFKVVTNGELALQYVLEEAIPDIVLLDLNMPVVDGFEFMETLKERGIVIPCVYIISTYIRPKEHERLAELGCHEVLEKPLTIEKLAQILDALKKPTGH